MTEDCVFWNVLTFLKFNFISCIEIRISEYENRNERLGEP